ncbi:MAG: hypothetical protein JXJ22_00365 [Bacteroidales bacterium]|nr:hypothetical protein [Bacteroidales bacterium]
MKNTSRKRALPRISQVKIIRGKFHTSFSGNEQFLAVRCMTRKKYGSVYNLYKEDELIHAGINPLCLEFIDS